MKCVINNIFCSNRVSQLASISFLGLCEKLEHLTLSGNDVENIPEYRETIKKWIPKLKTLDGISFGKEGKIMLSILGKLKFWFFFRQPIFTEARFKLKQYR